MIVYILRNSINGKLYVGLTSKSIKRRLTDHWRNALNGRTEALYGAIRKYGAKAFAVYRLARTKDRKQTQHLERKWIQHYDTYVPKGYNMTLGGDGRVGITHSAATIVKMKRSQKKRWASATAKQRKEHGDRIRTIVIARYKVKPKARGWASGNKGKVRSTEFRAKVSASMKQYVKTLKKGEMSRRSRQRHYFK